MRNAYKILARKLEGRLDDIGINAINKNVGMWTELK
jgi:hypothetical protein